MWRTNGPLYVSTPTSALRGDWLKLGPEDGIAPAPTPTDLFADTDGSIWFIEGDGILHFSPPADFLTNFPVPPVFVGGIASGTEAPALESAVTNLPRGQAVHVSLGSLQFDRRSALRFSYRLLPGNGNWTEVSSTDLALVDLGWGHHTLQIRARLGDSAWSPVYERQLYVSRPIWLGWSAVSGYLALLAALTFGVARLRKQRIEKLSHDLPEIGEWRLNVLTPELQQIEGRLLDQRFEVGQVIARGGFAVVTEGWDRFDERRCAIKVFRQDVVDKKWISRRFKQEVLALEKVHHPNVVRIFGSGVLPAGGLYLVMEFIEGATLREVLETGAIAPERVAEYLLQIGSALAEIHSHGICHRDLKPENLMLRDSAAPHEELVLIDFSIAIVKDPDVTVHGLSRAAGTISYMAPEQAIGYADPSTDIYSLARIILELITGKRLSELLPDASMDLPDRVLEFLSSLQIRFSTPSMELLSSALHFDPARRPKDAMSFACQIASDLASVRQNR